MSTKEMQATVADLGDARRPDQAKPPVATSRNAGIDALRASLTLLVVFHHAAVTYGGGFVVLRRDQAERRALLDHSDAVQRLQSGFLHGAVFPDRRLSHAAGDRAPRGSRVSSRAQSSGRRCRSLVFIAAPRSV